MSLLIKKHQPPNKKHPNPNKLVPSKLNLQAEADRPNCSTSRVSKVFLSQDRAKLNASI